MASLHDTVRLRDLPRSFFDRYNVNGPRYTSYPTAPEWTPAFGPREFADRLARTREDWGGRALSLYLHIPFCQEHCTFCACNVIISPKGRAVSDPYLAELEREIAMHAALNDPARPVVQFHWGGGTPTYLDCEQIERLHESVASRFALAPGCEKSIEVHPPVTTDDQIRLLARLGFNRLSMGVQDFDPRTQEAINRIQSYERTREITDLARSLGFRGINYDLVYGLPYQSEATFARTLDLVLEARPDRLAFYNFAFLPELLAHQRPIDPATLPDDETRFRIFLMAHDRFLEAGYRFIGMDHFALPDDELSVALENGTLRRNFMGFTTAGGTDLIGMGVSAISSVDDAFAQNHKKLTQYAEALDRGELPVERGIRLTDDDRIRRKVISDIMCRGRLEKAEVEAEFADVLGGGERALDDAGDADADGEWVAEGRFDIYFADELRALEPMVADGLLETRADGLELGFLGRLLARNIAMVFDARLRAKSRAAEAAAAKRDAPGATGEPSPEGTARSRDRGPRFSRTL